MRFLAPTAFWLLAALPVIILLYMLRARRQDAPISAVALWERARRDLAAQLPVRRLERNLVLLLQLLAALLLIAALARPQITLRAGSATATVLVLDTSASMQAADVAPNRFAAARTMAAAEIALPGGPVMVIAAAAGPRLVTPFTDRATARSLLARLVPSDGPSDLEQAVAMALAQRPAGGSARVIVFTDRAPMPVPGVTYRVVGRAAANVGITGLRTARAAGGIRAVVQITNAGDAAVRVPLRVTVADRPVLDRAVAVPAGATVSVVAAVPSPGVVRAQISPQDVLAVDDVAVAVAGGPAPRVLLLGGPDRVLEEALAAIPATVVSVPRPDARQVAAADVIVLNQTPPAELPPGNYLLIGTVATNLPLVVDGTIRQPQIVRWSTTHPVLRYVDLQDVTIARALQLRPRGGEVLAEGEGPLIWAYDGGAVRAVVVGFALGETDLPLAVAFPIFLSNAVQWLAAGTAAPEAGQPLVVPARGALEAVLVDPAGTRSVLAARSGAFVVPVLDRAGLYTLQAGDRRHIIPVQLPPSEVQIAPIAPAAVSPVTPVDARRQERSADLAPLMIFLAILVLFAEWAMWIRGLPRAHTRRIQAVVRR